jgi:hypothetical protein
MIETVRELISTDRRMTLWIMEEEVSSNNSSSKTSVSGKRKLVPLACQSETSHCGINKGVFGKTTDYRVKSPPILSCVFPTRRSLIPKNQITLKRERI